MTTYQRPLEAEKLIQSIQRIQSRDDSRTIYERLLKERNDFREIKEYDGQPDQIELAQKKRGLLPSLCKLAIYASERLAGERQQFPLAWLVLEASKTGLDVASDVKLSSRYQENIQYFLLDSGKVECITYSQHFDACHQGTGTDVMSRKLTFQDFIKFDLRISPHRPLGVAEALIQYLQVGRDTTEFGRTQSELQSKGFTEHRLQEIMYEESRKQEIKIREQERQLQKQRAGEQLTILSNTRRALGLE